MTLAHAMAPLPSGAVVHTWTPGRARGVVVLQHGFGEYAERYVEQHSGLVPRLVDAGFEVRALDLWGHGRSPGRRAVTSVRLAVRDHLSIRQQAGAAGLPVLLVGHSLGGLITAGSVLAAPEDMAGVVLLSPALQRPEPALVRRALGLFAALAPALPFPRPRQPIAELSRIPEVGKRAAADPAMFDGQVPLLLAATALDVAAEVWSGQTQWRVPTLLMHGTADTYTDPSASADLAMGIASVDEALTLIDGAFHELLNDECADEVLELLVTWLDVHASGRQGS